MTMMTIGVCVAVVVVTVRVVAWGREMLSRGPLDLTPMSARWLAAIKEEPRA